MPTTKFDKESIKQSIIGKLQRYNGRTLADATNQQIYHALASTVRDQIMQKWVAYREKDKHSTAKRLYYLSVEFLTGRSLHCNVLNLCSSDVYRQAMEELRRAVLPEGLRLNLTPIDSQQLIPAPGVYAVKVRLEHSMEQKHGMMNIGMRPTFDGHKRTLEVHVFRLNEDLYGQQLLVSFVERLREEQRFDNVEALINQLQQDAVLAEQILTVED